MPLNISVTQFPGGLGTAKDNSVLNSLPLPSPNVALSVEDFDMTSNFDNIWSATAIGAGAIPVTLPSGSGILNQASALVAGAGNKYAATAGASQTDLFEFAQGREVWFGMRMMSTDWLNSVFLLGFVPDAATVAPVDGVYLRSADVSANLEIVSRNAGVEVVTVLGQPAINTWYDLAFYYDGINKISAQFSGPDGVIGGGGTVLPGALLPSVGLQPSFAFFNGAANPAVIMDVDYILFGSSR